MPKLVGKVEMYRWFECPEGCRPNKRLSEECRLHTKEETEAMLMRLREDLAGGWYIVLRWEQGTVSVYPKGSPILGEFDETGCISVNEDGQSFHIELYQSEEQERSVCDVSFLKVLSVEIDDIDMWDNDHHPVVYWRHEIDFCDDSCFYRCDYLSESKEKQSDGEPEQSGPAVE